MSVACSPDNKWVAGATVADRIDKGVPHALLVRSMKNGEQQLSYRQADTLFTSVDWSHDGKWIVTGMEDGRLARIETSNWHVANEWNTFKAPIASVSFGASSNEVAVAQRDQVKVFNLKTGRFARSMK